MQDQQVEVLPGPHAAARVAGAVVLVAHRGPGRPTTDSPAGRALVGLAELVYEAAARHPDGPGAAIAREATRWLTARADRTGPGTSVGFGILSAAGPGRVAIFLHGAVTAVVAGESTEYFHGRDAVFTVDRAVTVPSRAVALFADDPLVAADDAAEPELPADRGIGRLVEGIAEAHAVIVWSPPARWAPGSGAAPSAGRRGVVLGKPSDTDEAAPARDDRETRPSPRRVDSSPGVTLTAAETPHRTPVPQAADERGAAASSAGPQGRPAPGSPYGTGSAPGRRGREEPGTEGSSEDRAISRRSADAPAGGSGERAGHGISSPRTDPDEVVTAAASPVDSVQLSEQATVAAETGPGAGAGGDPASGAQPADTDPHRAQTEISGRQPPGPGGERRADIAEDETAEPRRAGPGLRPLVHPTPRMDLPVSPVHGPPERATPPLDAELRRRTEATAKGTALTVKVRGFKCARAHPTDPRSAFCSVCGMPVDQTQPLIEVMRPPLGILVLDDGSTYLLETDSVLGRDPEKSEPARRGLTPLQVTDNSGGMSRAHVELRLVDWDVQLVDRGSTNGTRTRATGHREWVRIPPHQPVILVPGTEILIGNRMLRFESAAPPPFGL